MPVVGRYLIVKKKDQKEIVYMDYDKMAGYDITPKKNVKWKDAIHVDRMILIQPDLIQKMIQKKWNKKLQQLLKLLSLVEASDDESGTGYREVLSEVERLRREVLNRFRIYLEKEQLNLMEQQLNIIEDEVYQRMQLLYQNSIEEKGKAR